ncbi:MAG: helix-turn-helix domain-containing protein [Paludibacteraceae bacterium]
MFTDYATNRIIGQRVRQLRNTAGITQYELALRSDIEPSNLCRIEAGRTNLTVNTMRCICTALDIPFYKLTEGII